MKNKLLLIIVPFLVFPGSARSQSANSPCAELKKKLQPQNTPELTYRLELDIMKQGAYCHDLPIYDPEWRVKSAEDSYGDNLKSLAQMFEIPFKTYLEGKYAILYYPQPKAFGPVFLYQENNKWILDRTTVNKYIHYGQEWIAYDGDYPYLPLLKKIFTLELGTAASGTKAYRVKNKIQKNEKK